MSRIDLHFQGKKRCEWSGRLHFYVSVLERERERKDKGRTIHRFSEKGQDDVERFRRETAQGLDGLQSMHSIQDNLSLVSHASCAPDDRPRESRDENETSTCSAVRKTRLLTRPHKLCAGKFARRLFRLTLSFFHFSSHK